MGFTRAPDPEEVRAARRRFLDAAGMDPAAAVSVLQVHGSRVLRAGREAAGLLLGEADGLVTAERGLPLLVLSADCCVGVVAAGDGRALGVFHAGWRGAAAGAPAATVRTLEREFGVAPASMRAVLGPAIGPCCYEVGEEVAREFPGCMAGRRLDLPGAVRAGLAAAGIPPASIGPAGPCTLCGEGWFSHRRGDPGRQVLAAVLE
jgi:YfiH family protein